VKFATADTKTYMINKS